MTDKLLQNEDIIEIKPGMKLSVEVPEMFVYKNRLNSEKLANLTIIVGEVIHTESGNLFDTNSFAGHYVVQDARMTENSKSKDINAYPDGYHIIATKLSDDKQYNPNGIIIEFYQSGPFNCVITPQKIQSQGKLVRKFVKKTSQSSKTQQSS